MSSASDEAWGQLVCTSDPIADNILISKNKFVIGRSKGADLSLTGNKLVSGAHCVILKDDDHVIWLKDTSSNGTLLNYKTKLLVEKAELKHGDEFHLVYKKDETHHNVSYMYQDLMILKAEEEEEATQEYSDLDTSTTQNDSPSAPSSPVKMAAKRRHDSSSQESGDGAAEKKVKLDDKLSKDGEAEVEKNEGKKKTEDETKKATEDEKKETEGMEDDLICIICQEILYDCVSCQPCLHCFCAGCYSDWMKRSNECPACRVKVDKVNKNHMVNKVVGTFLREHPHRKRAQEELDELDKRNKIKRDSVKPPPPRKTMSEMIDDEDRDSNEERSESEEDEDDPDYDPGSGLVSTSPFGPGVLGTTASPGYRFTGMTGLFGAVTTFRPPKTVCRQCPEYREDGATLLSSLATAATAVTRIFTGGGGSTAPGPSATAGPSTASEEDPDAKKMPVAPTYKCPDSQVHLMCQCCLKPMPDRRTDRVVDESIPHQQCALCFRMFCHMYWGCKKDECLGCLARFEAMNFGKKILSSVVLENNYESEVLKGYLEEQTMSTQDLLEECCARFQAGDYTTADQIRGFNTSTVTCFSCGLRNFRELAYQYRLDIPSESIPTVARSRPDCYWGKECRTQRKMAHAVRFNHICVKSKTS